MKKTINFLMTQTIVLISFVPICQAQRVPTLDMNSTDMKEMRVALRQQDKEKEVLRQHLDSLFLRKEYKKIIQECSNRQSEAHLGSLVRYNLIAAHFFEGNIDLSKSLVEKEFSKYTSGIAASNLLSENQTGYLYFLSIDKNWKYIEKKVKEIAMKASVTQSYTEKKKGLQLFDFFIADQKNRLFHDYTDENKDRLHKFKKYKSKRQFEKKAEQICKVVFEFYRKEGKLFSEAEVGELHYIQLVFLLHDNDTKRREYYLELLNDAVTAGVFPIDKKIDFLIVNELKKVKWNNTTKVVTEQEEKMRMQYNLPNYKFSLVM